MDTKQRKAPALLDTVVFICEDGDQTAEYFAGMDQHSLYTVADERTNDHGDRVLWVVQVCADESGTLVDGPACWVADFMVSCYEGVIEVEDLS
ncbi:MAG: hypothetical protein GY814_06025 [Gammaproteobacteria bacterium]|nr:hypothetical protein [Gammaproteobacteria bacterium]